jgi:hypothetical protein
MKFSASRVAVATLISSTFALPTWPASTDEVEELLFQVSGYKSRGLADLVTPCSKSPAGPGRIAAAEWLRTAFHDMSTFGVDGPGTGGLDASLVFELTIPQNRSPAFSTTLKNLAAFYGAHASMADIIALGTYASVRSCGGPSIPIRAGRIDATASGPRGVPDPDNTISSFKTQFKRMGFTDAEMVEITACGHTLGGVHSGPFPQIVPRGTAPNDYKLFDDPTDAGSRFDNRIAVDYLAGNTTNPLATGPSVQNGFDSDRRIFQVDGDATVRKLADARVFQEQCRLVLAKMLDTVPTGVVLSEVVKAYEVKPVGVQLTLVNGGADLKFEGEIRVRTTSNKGVTGASVVYKKRDGSAGGTITTTLSGTGAGFDETFSVSSADPFLTQDLLTDSFRVVLQVLHYPPRLLLHLLLHRPGFRRQHPGRIQQQRRRLPCERHDHLPVPPVMPGHRHERPEAETAHRRRCGEEWCAGVAECRTPREGRAGRHCRAGAGADVGCDDEG